MKAPSRNLILRDAAKTPLPGDEEESKMEKRNATVAVIGAGDYIGGEIAKKFAAEGFTVFAGRRDGAKLEPLVKEIEASGGSIVARTLDALTAFFLRYVVLPDRRTALWIGAWARAKTNRSIRISVSGPRDTPVSSRSTTPRRPSAPARSTSPSNRGRPGRAGRASSPRCTKAGPLANLTRPTEGAAPSAAPSGRVISADLSAATDKALIRGSGEDAPVCL